MSGERHRRTYYDRQCESTQDSRSLRSIAPQRTRVLRCRSLADCDDIQKTGMCVFLSSPVILIVVIVLTAHFSHTQAGLFLDRVLQEASHKQAEV